MFSVEKLHWTQQQERFFYGDGTFCAFLRWWCWWERWWRLHQGNNGSALNCMVCFKSYLFRQVVLAFVSVCQIFQRAKFLGHFSWNCWDIFQCSKLVEIPRSTRRQPNLILNLNPWSLILILNPEDHWKYLKTTRLDPWLYESWSTRSLEVFENGDNQELLYEQLRVKNGDVGCPEKS